MGRVVFSYGGEGADVGRGGFRKMVNSNKVLSLCSLTFGYMFYIKQDPNTKLNLNSLLYLYLNPSSG